MKIPTYYKKHLKKGQRVYELQVGCAEYPKGSLAIKHPDTPETYMVFLDTPMSNSRDYHMVGSLWPWQVEVNDVWKLIYTKK